MSPLARCVMVQGTASHVGKSVIATALCRVLREEGFSVAPFKAQNMSLNAAVTTDGGEIGRAQAVQAEAAGVVARVEMNPVLLKPEGDSRTQVVVLGRSTGSCSASEYWTRRQELWPTVLAALTELRRQHEVVVIEGAGSPAELNLRRSDLANGRIAAAARAAVLLVGDIERGGIFAQLLGTLDLLSASERGRVRGLLVNKFRGDPALFTEGVRILQRRGGVPVLGVLPHAALGVASEDSLSLDGDGDGGSVAGPDIAVVRYPHISNFDELEPLAQAGAVVRYVRNPGALGVPDLVVLPGTKTTIADLEWLRSSGIAAGLLALADAGVPVLGICGGFQMLGEDLDDRDGVEGTPSRTRGLGLLPIRTDFTATKTTLRVGGVTCRSALGIPSGASIEGYELHLGETTRDAGTAFAEIVRPDGSRVLDGAVSADGRVVGTYVHGLFNSELIRHALFVELARRRGRQFAPLTLPPDRFARLSAWFRASVDVPKLLATCEITRG